MTLSEGIASLVLAWLIDLAVGDPSWLPHPVRGIGWLIRRVETALRAWLSRRKPENRRRDERAAGFVLAAAVVLLSVAPIVLLLAASARIHPALRLVLNTYFLASGLAGRCLGDEAGKVHAVLRKGDLPEARRRLAMLVGRETDRLDAEGVARATVETTAENTVDGVLSPMLFALAGVPFGLSAPFAWAFKAISTLDSMVGYRNERYMHFGTASARADDVANFLPARLSGWIIPAAARFCGLDAAESRRIVRRDHGNHSSPNCAWPESAFAGALGIRLGGRATYFGKTVEKPTIGDARHAVEAEEIPRAVLLMHVSSTLTLACGILLLVGIAALTGLR